MLLVIIFSIIILIIGLAYIGLGIYLLIYGKIGNMTLPKLGRYLSIGLGILICFMAIGILVYVLIQWNRPFRPILADASDDIESTLNINYGFYLYNPTLQMFTNLIYSTKYEDGQYKSHNFRGSNVNGIYSNAYTKFFQNEINTLTESEQDLLNSYKTGDNDFDNNKVVLIWKLYKAYIGSRYDHKLTLKQIDIYYDLVNRIIGRYDPSIIDTFKTSNFGRVANTYVSIFKMIHRNLIPYKYGSDILMKLKPLLLTLVNNTTRSEIDVLNIRLNKELERKDYHPVRLLHQYGIRFGVINHTKATLGKYFIQLNNPTM